MIFFKKGPFKKAKLIYLQSWAGKNSTILKNITIAWATMPARDRYKGVAETKAKESRETENNEELEKQS